MDHKIVEGIKGGVGEETLALATILLRRLLRKLPPHEVETDCNCDSEFMLRHMDRLGHAARSKFYWVPMDVEIDCIMDNAGGHGTDEAKAEYTDLLKENHNIRVVWQVPQSPETNILDLGVWCSLQSYVEIEHRLKMKSSRDALARTCETVWWTKFPASKFDNVSNRWIKVLKIICNTKGDNVKSDAFRGKNADVPEVNLDALQAELDGNQEVDADEEEDEDLELDD